MSTMTNISKFNYYKRISSNGDFEKRYGIKRIVDTLTNVLNTKRGTYPGDAEFGNILHTFLYEQLDEFTSTSIEQEIKYIAEVYVPEATITNLQVITASDKKGFYAVITISYNEEEAKITIEGDSTGIIAQ